MNQPKSHLFLHLIFILTVSPLTIILYLSPSFEAQTHFMPSYQKLSLSTLLSSDLPKAEKDSLIFFQTGLSSQSISLLSESESFSLTSLQKYQDYFFTTPSLTCKQNSPISYEEHMKTPFHFAPLKDGDVLITSASHTFFWRNGHAALVIDAKNGKTLESVVLGQNSCIQSIEKWRTYPNVAVLRPKNGDALFSKKLVETALLSLNNIPYRLSVGILSKKEKASDQITGTHCAHLVWEAYILQGIDIDSDGGMIVTPHDILFSDAFEVVQIYGMNPADFT